MCYNSPIELTKDIDMTSLQEARDIVLSKVTENYHFGNCEVVGMDGWEYYSYGTKYSRAVYLEYENSDFSTKVFLTVIFKDVDSSEVDEVYAIDQKGCIIGSLEQ